MQHAAPAAAAGPRRHPSGSVARLRVSPILNAATAVVMNRGRRQPRPGASIPTATDRRSCLSSLHIRSRRVAGLRDERRKPRPRDHI